MLGKPLLTTHEVATLLKVKEATVRAWIRAGELPAVQLNREWRIAVKHLEEFVESRLITNNGTEPSKVSGAALEAGATEGRARTTRKSRRLRRTTTTENDDVD